MTSTISDAERCVDELLGNLPRLNELIGKFEEPNEVSPDTIEESKKLASQITKFIEENHVTHQIPPYVVEKVQNSVFKLQKLISDKDLSKFKFCFKPTSVKSPPKSTQPIVTSKDVKVNDQNIVTPQESLNGIKIENKTEEIFVLSGNDVDDQDVTLINLENCSVSIIGKAETIYIRELDNTDVTICLAARAVTVRQCRDCRFKIVCQQLRIDETFTSRFDTFIKTRAMLESSRNLQFAPLDIDQMSAELTHQKDAHQTVRVLMDKMDFKQNNWRCIDDFDWLSPYCPSKNYVLVER